MATFTVPPPSVPVVAPVFPPVGADEEALEQQPPEAPQVPAIAAAADPAVQPSGRYILFALFLIVVGLFVGWRFQQAWHPDLNKLPTVAEGFEVFALFYIAAQVIERILEPVSWFGGGFLGFASGHQRKTKSAVVANRDRKTVAARNQKTETAIQEAANGQKDVDQYRLNLTATSFGIASLLAMLASGGLGIMLLRTVGVTTAPVGLDILVTGLALAGGTKPLHDLISNVTKSKDDKQDPVETR